MMASKRSFADAFGNSHFTSILEINHEAKPSAGILKAYELLGLEHLKQSQSFEVEDYDPENAHPSYEFVLKYLLKSFESELERNELFLSELPWRLFRYALPRMPPAKVAGLLKHYHFVKALKAALDCLYQTHREQDSLTNGQCESRLSPSSTIGERQNPPSTNLGEVGTVPLQSSLPSDECMQIFAQIINCSYQIQALLDNRPSEHDQMTVEYLKYALRDEDGEATPILGTSLLLYHSLILDKLRSQANTKAPDIGLHSQILDTIIGLWQVQSTRTGGASDHVTKLQENFARHCLHPALILLYEFGDSVSQKSTYKKLETIVIENIIKPARESYHESSERDAKKEESCLDPLRNNLSHLVKNNVYPDSSRDLKSVDSELVLSSLVFLFDIAVRSRPRETPTSRRKEVEFLREIFRLLTSFAGTILSSQFSNDVEKRYAKNAKIMLNAATESGIQIDTTTIHSVLEQGSDLFTEDIKGRFDTDLVGGCLENNSDAFVVPLDGAPNAGYSYRPPNKYLAALLSRMTNEHWRTPKSNELRHEKVVSIVAIPLLQGFVHARDLLGFLGHLREELNKFERSCVIQYKGREKQGPLLESESIWEAEAFSLAVIKSIESSLSMSQVESAVALVQRCLEATQEERQDVIGLGDLFVLDCLFAGCKQEGCESLADCAQTNFGLLGKLNVGLSSLYKTRNWRIWRTLTTLVQRWMDFGSRVSWVEAANIRAARALAMFEMALKPPIEISTLECSNLSFIFKFLLTCFSLGKHDQASEGLGTVQRAVRSLLEMAVEPEAGDANRREASPSPSHNAFSSNDQRIQGSPVRELLMTCIEQLIETASAMSCLDLDQQNDMFEQIFLEAQKGVQSPGPSSLGAPTSEENVGLRLWRKILESQDFSSIREFRNNTRNCLSRSYLDNLDPAKSKSHDIQTQRYKTAFVLIKLTPPTSFSREQRTLIADRVLEVLLENHFDTSENFINHLQLLIDLTKIPNRSMNIFRKPTSAASSVSIGIRGTDVPTLFVIAWKLDNEVQNKEERVQCSRWLICLARNIFKYIFSTLEQESSSKYLLNFTQFIAAELQASDETHQAKSRNQIAGLGTILLTLTILETFKNHAMHVPESHRVWLQPVNDLRKQHLILVQELSGLQKGASSTSRKRLELDVLFQLHVNYADLLAVKENAAEEFTKFVGALDSEVQKSSASEGRLYSHESTMDTMTRMKHRFWLSRESLSPFVPKAFGCLVTGSTSSVGPSPALQQELIASLSEDRLQEFLSSSMLQGLAASKELSRTYLLRSTLYRINERHIEQCRSSLSKILIDLLGNMHRHKDYSLQMISMQCIALFLGKLPRAVNQYHIDSTLSAIAICASHINTDVPSTQNANLFIGLCRIFGFILTGHRSKIGGRYHLVLLALQSLLQCLFTPYQSPAAAGNAGPGNDSPSSSSSSPPFSKIHAQTYARLLTTLCDPSPSAVARRRGQASREQLNDETKRAKKTAGRYMQYLIMTYCECRLKARLVGDGMKEALEPGLWAVLNCMDQDVMRTLNSAMDKSGRAVWKRLYNEWREFGQWRGG